MSLLEVKNISKCYSVSRRRLGLPQQIEAIRNINFKLDAGETLAIVGESGSGKSTLARQIIGIEKPTSGKVYFNNEEQNPRSRKQRKNRFRNIRMVFQNPYESLNPQARIGETLDEVLQINTKLSSKQRKEKIATTLVKVGMLAEHQYRYPHMFSGGQRQRIAIARAIILDPQIIIADEPLSALDVSIQAQILNLLQELQEQMGISYLFISHDLNIVEHIADRVMVMFKGEVIEYGGVDQIFDNPKHPYTQTLFASTPMYRQRFPEFSTPKTVGKESTKSTGCQFAGRCNYCSQKCLEEKPELFELDSGHRAACFKTTK
ncbi:oligopeptide/dipeptide ABC transporter ATP-binding protein [Aliikangiella sp. G2MR2-5]|uniref:oligopeptide/dipeptide ABC transporter ATP-binding protein n=1 Tax=Aliikangiella sp. G2MR2-5 TaxID=2788943 RepID=UPI0018A9A9D8|nr:oligopeptide/dipeptide ABC transporter ATP-binding protein [Aliikangiella sp. G2MR2-5]